MKMQLITEGAPECPLVRIYDYDEMQLNTLESFVSKLAAGQAIGQAYDLEGEEGEISTVHVGLAPGNGAFVTDCGVKWGGGAEYWAEVGALIAEMMPISGLRNRYQWLSGPHAHYDSDGISVLLSEIDGGLW